MTETWHNIPQTVIRHSGCHPCWQRPRMRFLQTWHLVRKRPANGSPRSHIISAHAWETAWPVFASALINTPRPKRTIRLTRRKVLETPLPPCRRRRKGFGN